MSVIITERFQRVFTALKELALGHWDQEEDEEALQELTKLMSGQEIDLDLLESNARESRDADWVYLLIITYQNLYQAQRLLKLVLQDSMAVSSDLSYWARRKEHPVFYYHEQTPWFWWKYYTGKAAHPIVLTMNKLKVLNEVDEIAMTFLGSVYLSLAVPSSLEDLYRLNHATLASCRQLIYGENGQNFKESKDIRNLILQLKDINVAIQTYDMKESYIAASQPPWYQRKWLLLTLGCIGGFCALRYTALHIEDIKTGIMDVFEATIAFGQTQMKTLFKAIETIRYEKNEDLTEIQTRAVEASEESLARMVLDFNRQHVNLTPEEMHRIEEAAKYGDLSTIMPSYEKEIEKPIKGALFGEFIRLVLIQVQKQKVDVERVMLQLDKLLRTNELNFTVLALLPAISVAYSLYHFVVKERTNKHAEEMIRNSLRQVHSLLNKNNSGNNELGVVEYGRLIVSLNTVREFTQYLNRKVLTWMVEDLQEIETERYSVRQRLATVDRMYRTYKFLGI
eukprot:TRINITY_DN5668_c0_g1_i2.p1 TRINITY_DN5668_c0_g1~~TRINITY_DN5668_c0_g1_i2.p1  ORF type:complete len:510 (-),score=83.37 TRINITY_DN5668_c0_g1_i2:64-1593(-)